MDNRHKEKLRPSSLLYSNSGTGTSNGGSSSYDNEDMPAKNNNMNHHYVNPNGKLKGIMDRFQLNSMFLSASSSHRLGFPRQRRSSTNNHSNRKRGFHVKIPTKMVLYTAIIFIVLPLSIGFYLVIHAWVFGIQSEHDHQHLHNVHLHPQSEYEQDLNGNNDVVVSDPYDAKQQYINNPQIVKGSELKQVVNDDDREQPLSSTTSTTKKKGSTLKEIGNTHVEEEQKLSEEKKTQNDSSVNTITEKDGKTSNAAQNSSNLRGSGERDSDTTITFKDNGETPLQQTTSKEIKQESTVEDIKEIEGYEGGQLSKKTLLAEEKENVDADDMQIQNISSATTDSNDNTSKNGSETQLHQNGKKDKNREKNVNNNDSIK